MAIFEESEGSRMDRPRVQRHELPDFMRDSHERTASSEDGLDGGDSVSSAPQDGGDFEKAITGLAMTKAVYYSRLAILGVLGLCTIGVACFVYRYTDQAELDQFEQTFEEDSRKVLQSVGSFLDFNLGLADSFGVDEINSADDSNQTWPFVTTKRYAVRAAKLRSLTNALLVNTYPVVRADQREAWENYSVTNDAWVDQGLRVQTMDKNFKGVTLDTWTRSKSIYANSGDVPHQAGDYYPTWQTSPVVPRFPPYNWNLGTEFPIETAEVVKSKKALIGLTDNLPSDDEHSRSTEWIEGYIGPDEDPTEPLYAIYYPILMRNDEDVVLSTDDDHELVEIVVLIGFWRDMIRDVLPPGSNGITVVIGNECGQQFTYRLHGPSAEYLGDGDHHETKYSDQGSFSNVSSLSEFAITDSRYSGAELSDHFCPYWIKLYPSDELLSEHTTNDPIIFTTIAVFIFLFTSVIFLVYDHLTRTRQQRTLKSALKHAAVVTSLFPQSVRDKVLESRQAGGARSDDASKGKLHSFLRNNSSKRSDAESEPIAEQFLDVTVMIADIAMFTEWSSVRDARSVFTLLEKLFGAFDRLSKRWGVYKVESSADTYVAVCGLPEKRNDHASLIARYAAACREIMAQTTHDLDIDMGPGTSELQMRFGLSSGAVTAGVLRCERSRFQLFGDTVNTAACMEQTGIANKIHASQATADLLIAAGKQHWVTRRRDSVTAKGKGIMQTFWVEPKQYDALGSEISAASSESEDVITGNKLDRLVDWNIELLGRLLKNVIAAREGGTQRWRTMLRGSFDKNETSHTSPLDEVIDFMDFSQTEPNRDISIEKADLLPESVAKQLQSFVRLIASRYGDNAYHSFPHASHVSMSLVKSFGRISGPGGSEEFLSQGERFGLTSDPLAKFACMFAALVHDVDHPGVSNAQLVVEGSADALAYGFKSVAEQKSIDSAWEILHDSSYGDLRKAICASQEETRRFRQLLVNLVISTDLLDGDLRDARDRRWRAAFPETPFDAHVSDEQRNLRSTLVLELLLQASDIAHTMQHWLIYSKWNEKLFEESLAAYHGGRGHVNPADYWYDGELAFFDDVVLPLARYLRDSRIFGVSSEELLNYALRNREEWERKGQEVVASMVRRLRPKFRAGPSMDCIQEVHECVDS